MGKSIKPVSYNPDAGSSAGKYNQRVYAYDPSMSIEQNYKRLAKTADQRLVRLERLAEQEGYESVTKYAYHKAMRDIKAWDGEDAMRFNTRIPGKRMQQIAKINDILDFLNSATSTKKGIDATYKKRAQSLNEKYGTDFTWQDMSDYYSSGRAAAEAEQYGSKTVLKALGKFKKHGKDILNDMYNSQRKGKHLSDQQIADKLGIDSLDSIESMGQGALDKIMFEAMKQTGTDIIEIAGYKKRRK